MNFRSQRAAEPRSGSVLFCIRSWGDQPSALWFKREECVRVLLPTRTRCAMFRRRNLRLRWDGRIQPVHAIPRSSSAYTAHVLLRTPVRDDAALRLFVEEAIVRGIKLIATVGAEAGKVEAEVDRIIIGNPHGPYDKPRFIATTAHDTSRDAVNYIALSAHAKRFFEVWL